jgi:hypothetical protein
MQNFRLSFLVITGKAIIQVASIQMLFFKYSRIEYFECRHGDI